MARRLRTVKMAGAEPGYEPFTERYLRRLVSERRLPFFKTKGRVLVDLDDLDRYVESCRIEPPRELRSVGSEMSRPLTG